MTPLAESGHEWSPPWRTKLAAWLEAGTEFDRILRVALMFVPAFRIAYWACTGHPAPVLMSHFNAVDLLQHPQQVGPYLWFVDHPLTVSLLCWAMDAGMLWKEGRMPPTVQRILNGAWFLSAAGAAVIGVVVLVQAASTRVGSSPW